MRFVSAIIAAGGTGSRLGLNIPKQFFRLDGRSILYHSVKPFSDFNEIDEIVVVTLSEYVDFCRDELGSLPKVKHIVVGGQTRQQSVYNGLKALDERCDLVVIHDAARPLVTKDDISRTINAADNCAAVAGVKVNDTIKLVNAEGYVEDTPKRANLRAVQTPQAVPYSILRKAYEKAEKEGFQATDDVSLAEFLGYPVRIVEGSSNNFKITTEIDLELAKILFKQN